MINERADKLAKDLLWESRGGGHSSGSDQRSTSWRKVAFELNLGSSVRDLKVEMVVPWEQRHGVYVIHCGWKVDVFGGEAE